MTIGMDTKPLDDLLAYWRSLPIADGAKAPANAAGLTALQSCHHSPTLFA